MLYIKDLAFKANKRTRNLTFKTKDRTEDLTFNATTKDLTFKTKTIIKVSQTLSLRT